MFIALRHQEGMEGVGKIGEYAKKGRGGPQSGGNVLQGGDTGGATFWLGELGTIGDNRYNGGRDSLQVSETNERAEGGLDIVYSSGGVIAGSSVNSVEYSLHQKKTGDSSTVGGAVVDIRGMRKGERIRGGRAQDRCIVAPRGARDTSQGNPGANIAGNNEETTG